MLFKRGSLVHPQGWWVHFLLLECLSTRPPSHLLPLDARWAHRYPSLPHPMTFPFPQGADGAAVSSELIRTRAPRGSQSQRGIRGARFFSFTFWSLQDHSSPLPSCGHFEELPAAAVGGFGTSKRWDAMGKEKRAGAPWTRLEVHVAGRPPPVFPARS